MSAPLSSDLKQVDPKDAWQPWSPSERQPFDAKWAGHLLRRATFGASPDEVRKAVRDGFDESLERLFVGDPRAAIRLELFDATGEEIARADDEDALRAWWLAAMVQGGHPLREKLTLFWHNHFATSIAKVRSPLLMFRQNQLLRKHALGSFGPMLGEISRDPAMLIWLDSNQNVKSAPNENFAREVMELFTLGVGNYTEKDIREAARAFTGWHVNGDGDGFELNAAEHDEGSKTVLGKTGNWSGEDVLRLLLSQTACSRFLAAKLYRFIVSETDPPKNLIVPLAEQLRQSDYDIGPVVQTILRSRLFFSEHAYQKRIKSPVEYVLGAVRAAWTQRNAPVELVSTLNDMGQTLFAPPNVKGWTGGKNWLTDATLLARHNFAERIASLPVNAPSTKDSILPATTLTSAAYPPTPPPPDATQGPAPREVGKSSGIVQARAVSESTNAEAGWYVRKMKAQASSSIVRAVGEQFFPGGLPDRARGMLETFLGGEPGSGPRVAEVIHAVMCLPEYQLC